jgi:hypothetical protein
MAVTSGPKEEKRVATKGTGQMKVDPNLWQSAAQTAIERMV